MTDAVEECRALARQARSGALATILSGAPYASLVAIAWDPKLHPILLLSGLAEHTKNLEADARASLLVVGDAPVADDALAAARMTLLGECAPIERSDAPEACAVFVAAHPEAAQYATFADFRVFRFVPSRIRLVAGFGRQAWVSGTDFLTLR
jgi:putative heme iron utilization protein